MFRNKADDDERVVLDISPRTGRPRNLSDGMIRRKGPPRWDQIVTNGGHEYKSDAKSDAGNNLADRGKSDGSIRSGPVKNRSAPNKARPQYSGGIRGDRAWVEPRPGFSSSGKVPVFLMDYSSLLPGFQSFQLVEIKIILKWKALGKW